MLEIALQFTQTVLFLLRPPSPQAASAREVKLERAHRRAAAARAVKLAAKFKQEVGHLALVLRNRQLKTVAGVKASHFLELLNFNGFYDKRRVRA